MGGHDKICVWVDGRCGGAGDACRGGVRAGFVEHHGYGEAAASYVGGVWGSAIYSVIRGGVGSVGVVPSVGGEGGGAYGVEVGAGEGFAKDGDEGACGDLFGGENAPSGVRGFCEGEAWP